MFDDTREIKLYNDDLVQQTVSVGKQGITKIECYAEKGSLDFIPYLAVYKDDVLIMRTPAIGKEIVYKT
jgi:hypothetical protein